MSWAYIRGFINLFAAMIPDEKEEGARRRNSGDESTPLWYPKIFPVDFNADSYVPRLVAMLMSGPP